MPKYQNWPKWTYDYVVLRSKFVKVITIPIEKKIIEYKSLFSVFSNSNSYRDVKFPVIYFSRIILPKVTDSENQIFE